MRLSGGSRVRAVLTGGLMVAGMIAIPMVARAAETSTSGSAPASSTKPAHERKHERHPEIQKAIKRLEAAKDDLQHASHDFGGHRVKAIQAVDQALAELHLALQFDKE